MIIEIGIVAGEIWHYLDQHGEVPLSVLVKSIDKPRDNILMSLGWLAREGHVLLQQVPYNPVWTSTSTEQAPQNVTGQAGSEFMVSLRKNA